MKPIFLLICLSLKIFQSFAIEPTSTDCLILDKFFRIMLEQSEGGYVLFVEKPVCINGFLAHDDFSGENERHKNLVFLREGAFVLKKLNLNPFSDDILIHSYDNPDSLAKNYIHILFISKKQFKDVFNKNITLFQYVLGPSVTAEGLLEKLTNPKETFHSILKNDKVLIGLLLGFGTENSIYVSRLENIQETLFSNEIIPYKSQLLKFGDIRNEFKEMLLLSGPTASSHVLPIHPSFGFQNLREEIQNLSAQIDIPSLKLVRQTPFFIFGRLKNNVETDNLIKRLESAQDEINKLIHSDTFLNDVVKMVYPNVKTYFHNNSLDNQIPFDNLSSRRLAYVVSSNIWKNMYDKECEYQNSFLEGIQDSHRNLPLVNFSEDVPQYKKLKVWQKIEENINNSDIYFKKLDQDKNYVKVSHLRLYYRTIHEGAGKILSDQTDVKLHYVFKDPQDNILVDTWMSGHPVSLNLNEVIPGLAWGMKGMKIGEIRELCIHPSVAYGIYTTFEKGVYLKANVQLIDMEFDKTKEYPELTILNFSDFPDNVNQKYKRALQKSGYMLGYQIWDHYKKSNTYSLFQVLNWIFLFKVGISSKTSLEDQNLNNRLHSNIYLNNYNES